MSTAETNISILIPTHNRCEILGRTLASLFAVQIPPLTDLEVVVVANGCTDRTREVVAECEMNSPFKIRSVDEPRLGLNIARNRAVQEARPESTWLIFLDDDVALDPQWLVGMKQAIDSTPADLLAGRISLWWEAVSKPAWMSRSMEGALSKLEMGDEICPTRHGVGANFAFKREVIEKVGGFVAGLDRVGNQVLSCGETEFIWRALAAGFQMFYAPRMYVKHWVAPHRATIQYVTNITRGFGQSMIFIREPFGPLEATKQIAGRLWLIVWLSILQVFAPLTRHNRLQYQMFRIYNVGALEAVFQRLRGKSPMKDLPPRVHAVGNADGGSTNGSTETGAESKRSSEIGT